MKPGIYTKPLVSIGMPAYNGEQFIRTALDSILAQEYKNFELVISDNASTDMTLKICSEYAIRDQRIKVFEQNHNIGALENFKFVLKGVRGKYFMWAAVDDYWAPGFIGELVNELEKYPEAGLAMCAVDRVNQNGEALPPIHFRNEDNPNDKTYYQMLKGLTSRKKYNLFIYGLFRTQLLLKAVLVFPNVPGLDRIFICHMALATRFRYIDKALHIRTVHTQLSRVRLSNEKFNLLLKDRWVSIKVLSALFKVISQSSIIPWHRKLYLPVALWRYGRLQLYAMIRFRIKDLKVKISHLFPDIWNFLKRSRSFLNSGRMK